MKKNPIAAITTWDQGEGYQIKGKITIETSGKRFEETAKWIEEFGKAMNVPLKSKGAVIMKVTEVYIVSPGEDAGKRIA